MMRCLGGLSIVRLVFDKHTQTMNIKSSGGSLAFIVENTFRKVKYYTTAAIIYLGLTANVVGSTDIY